MMTLHKPECMPGSLIHTWVLGSQKGLLEGQCDRVVWDCEAVQLGVALSHHMVGVL